MSETEETGEISSITPEEIRNRIQTLFHKWKENPNDDKSDDRESLEELSLTMRLAEKKGMELKFKLNSYKPLPKHPEITRSGKEVIVTIDNISEDGPIIPDMFILGKETSLENLKYRLGFKVGDQTPVLFNKSEVVSVEVLNPNNIQGKV